MGRKRDRARKYLHICIACIMGITLAGCVMAKEVKTRWNTRETLVAAEKFLEQGDYEKALRANQKVLEAQSSEPPADESLFNIGLIYAHQGYPKRDPEKSLDHFKRLLKLFPHSPYAGQAKVWIGVLQKYEKLSAENERLIRENEELKVTLKKSKQVDMELDVKKKELSK